MLWLLLFTSFVGAEDSWTVRTEYGEVRGFRSHTNVWEFMGIPYAGSPTGEHRYKAPIPPTPWTGVRDANDNTIMCRQIIYTDPSAGFQGQEDCLIINVFVPESGKSGEQLPVLFYIHGGGLVIGDSNGYNPSHITRHDVILVTFNYRLGSIGFICLGTKDIPGNAGLKDQIAALQWIQRNIANFGGNPNAVTIYGDSAGAVSAEALVLSKATNGLFQKAIIESGSALTDWALSYSRLGVAKGMALELGFGPVDNLTLLGHFFNSIPSDRLLQLTGSSFTRHVMCIERNFEDSVEAVHDSFRNIIENNDYVNIPIMFAYSDLEGVTFSGNFIRVINDLENNFESFLPLDLYFASDAEKTALASSLKTLYFGNQPITEESVRGYVDFLTDTMFITGLYRSATQHAKNIGTPVYVMEFAYRGGFNEPNIFYPHLIGAGHSDIVAHILDHGHSNPDTLEQDQIIRDRMTEMWTNFVKYGNPSSEGSSLPVTWQPFTVANENYLWMGPEMEMRNSPLADRMKVWVDIYEKYYLPPPVFEQYNSATSIYKMTTMIIISLGIIVT